MPVTVGRGETRQALDIINAFRAGLATPLAPIDPALLTLDPYRTLDLRFTKTWLVGSARHIELLVEAFNILNHVNFVPSNINRNMNSAQFLSRTSARDARQVQWGARVRF